MKKQHYIKSLIAQGEGAHLDFKFEISDAAKIARSLVAFANTNGGKLLIGVKDNGVIRGVRSEEEYYMLENAAQRFCQPKVTFSSKEWIVDGKKVLEVNIPFSRARPHRAPDQHGKYRAYVRIEDENILANGILMKLWEKQKANKNIQFVYTEPEQNLLNYLKEKGRIDLSTAIQITAYSKYKTEQLLSDLILLDVIKMEMTESTVLFLSKDLQEL